MKLRELSVRYTRGSSASVAPPITTPQAAAALVRPYLETEVVEVFGIVLFDVKRRPLAWFVIGRGGLSSVDVDVKSAIRAALLANAAGFILAHNHPSGDVTISPDDRALTARMVEACKLFDLDCADHLIIGAGRYASFREEGLL